VAVETIVIAGGGTGGHLYPGIAIAQELQRRQPALNIVFAGAGRPLERRIVEAHGYRLLGIASGGVVGTSIGRRIRGVLRAGLGFFEAMRNLMKLKPKAVIGVGGYASGPTVAAAIVLRLPTLIQEQNYYPGLTNRLLASWVSRVAISFEESRALLGGRGILTGNPIRGEFHAVRPAPHAGSFCLFVFGGSQGARAVNNAVIEALPRLAPHRAALRILHGSGPRDLERVRAAYAAAGFDADVSAYITDIQAAYAGADVVVARAGASTVSELAACARASILVPLPTAAHDHQRYNARKLEETGAAIMLEEKVLNGASLADTLIALMNDPERIDSMSRAAATLASPGAAAHIADLVDEMVA
jgi:UDP-N-acetylglucosamine--N-acetylmuramyl-(pentapeptide) pyrophosphoryl-undecaprenol N-acetylglucosamine transferase